MTVVLPVSAEPAAVAETPRQLGLWRRLPTKAKVGAIMLGAFIVAGIIGPLLSPYDPSFQNPSFSPVSYTHLTLPTN